MWRAATGRECCGASLVRPSRHVRIRALRPLGRVTSGPASVVLSDSPCRPAPAPCPASAPGRPSRSIGVACDDVPDPFPFPSSASRYVALWLAVLTVLALVRAHRGVRRQPVDDGCRGDLRGAREAHVEPSPPRRLVPGAHPQHQRPRYRAHRLQPRAGADRQPARPRGDRRWRPRGGAEDGRDHQGAPGSHGRRWRLGHHHDHATAPTSGRARRGTTSCSRASTRS